MEHISKEIILPDENHCTGCGLCANVCRKNAIKMSCNDEGFIYPEINETLCVKCGICMAKCPSLSYMSNNEVITDKCIAFMASDEIRSKSSSGGLFYSLSKKITDEGGVVVGAAFDDNLRLRLTTAENLEQIGAMQGSKYIQSDADNIYNEVKSQLDAGRKVLFTGCPCQVAAVKNYVGISDDLYTMDILCHGVPSQYLFQRYLTERFPDKIITDVKFRNKEHSWAAVFIDVYFSDGQKYSGSLSSGDTYEILFQKNIGLRKSCSDCRFCNIPRVGDISTGDFWGIEKIQPALNDKKGLSMVFVNNKKGEKLLNSIQGKQTEVSYDIKKIPNRFFPKYSAHPGRAEFFRLLKTKKLSEAVNMVESNKHDIGLVGIYTVENFGGALTYFALYKALQSMGHSVLMIERPNNSKHRPGVHKVYNVDPFPAFDKAKIYPDKLAMRELNNCCDTFVLGSDQLFHNTLYNNFAKWCTLDWVQDNKKKIAYAASFGHDKIFSSEQTCAEMSYFMKKFDYFSVREKSGVELARKYFGVEAQWVLDPVFLCEPEEYYKLAQNSTAPKKSNYISCYILDPNAEKANIIKEAASALNLDNEIFSEMKFYDTQLTNDFDLEINPDVIIENRLSSLINSDFVIADSFHGICFAIIFRKNFIAIPNSGRGKARFNSILDLLGLSDRMVETAAQLREKSYLLSDPIDYDKVYIKLDYEKCRGRIWLENAINVPIDKGLSTYDVLVDYIKGQLDAREAALSRREAIINRKIQRLISITGTTNKICSIDKFAEYFAALSEDKDRYIIAVAVKDTPGIPFSDEYYKAMSLIGVKTSLVNKHWHGYAALVNSGELIDEKCVYNQSVKICTEYENLKIEISSSPLNAGNRASVIVNGSEFAVNSRGVNIVVYDKIGRYVCDSISFDTHIHNAPSSR